MLRKKNSRIAVLIVTVALSFTALAGCGKNDSKGTSANTKVPQVIKYNLGAEPKTIDPALNEAVEGGTVIENAFEGLTRLDEKDTPIPGVAEKWDVSPDGLKYTFHLRKDAVWTDGKQVKAQDFEYAWKRALNPDTASNYAYQLYYIKNGQGYNESKRPQAQKTPGVAPATADQLGVKAVDDQTLEVTLENPCAYFLSLMAFPTYMPVRQDVIEKDKTSWAIKPDSYITNGPFKLKEWRPKDKMIFVKNDKYWNAKDVKLDTIEYSMLEQETSYLAAFKTGQLDFIETPPAQETPQLLKDGTAKITPYLGTYYINLNVSDNAAKFNAAAAQALKNPKVREALNLALDRKEIVDNVTKGNQIPAGAYVPKGIPEDKSGKDFRNKDYYNPQGDIAKAKQLLAEAGYPDGKGFPKLEYLYNTGQNHQNLAQAVQEMWRKNLGINVELKNQEWKVFQKTRTDKNYEIARGGWTADYVDPMTFLDMFTKGSGNNDPGYNNPNYDAKLAAAKKETDPAKRMQLMHDAEDMLMADMPIIPIYFYTNIVCVKDYVKDVHKSPLGFVYFDHTYIDKK